MVDKELELIVFEIKQDTGTGTQKIKSRQLMDDIFQNAESATIPIDLDIDDTCRRRHPGPGGFRV